MLFNITQRFKKALVLLSTRNTNKTNSNPFELKDDLHTVSYAPFNFQTIPVRNLIQSGLLEDMDITERKELRGKLSQMFEWELQESLLPPRITERETLEKVEHDFIACHDSSQIFTDSVTIRVPIQIVSDTKLGSEKKRKLMKHQFTIPVSASPPLFNINHHKHQYIATSNNI